MTRPLHRAARAYRKVLGSDTWLEKRLRAWQRASVSRQEHPKAVQFSGENFLVLRSKSDPEPVRGIYLHGACDLPALFAMAPLIVPELTGTVAILNRGHISNSRADVLLQTLEDFPPEALEETNRRMRLRQPYFEPVIFERTFTIPAIKAPPFPKSVVVLSLAPNVIRSLYRHKEHGFLVDPGGWWLIHSVEQAMADPGATGWFGETFEKVGRLTVEEWADHFRRLVDEIRSRTGAEILLFNTLTVEPGDPTHSYALRRRPEGARRREFHLAVAELSAELGFHVLDVDRVLKKAGITGHIDFAHFPTDTFGPLALEAHGIFRDLGVL